MMKSVLSWKTRLSWTVQLANLKGTKMESKEDFHQSRFEERKQKADMHIDKNTFKVYCCLSFTHHYHAHLYM